MKSPLQPHLSAAFGVGFDTSGSDELLLFEDALWALPPLPLPLPAFLPFAGVETFSSSSLVALAAATDAMTGAAGATMAGATGAGGAMGAIAAFAA